MAPKSPSSVFASLDLVVERAAWDGQAVLDVDAEVERLLSLFSDFRDSRDDLRGELALMAVAHGIPIRMGTNAGRGEAVN